MLTREAFLSCSLGWSGSLGLPRQVIARAGVSATLGAVRELARLVALEPLRLLALVVFGVRVDDATDERVPHDVVARQPDELDVFDLVEDARDEPEPTCTARQVDLGDVAGDDHLRP